MIAPLRKLPGGRDETLRPGAAPIGQLLVERAGVSEAQIGAALDRQAATRQKLGTTLVGLGAATEEDVARALAEQWRLGFADLDRDAPDPELIDEADLDVYLEHGILPWRRLGGITVYATTDPATSADSLEALLDPPPFAFFAVTDPARLHRALTRAAPRGMARRAALMVPDAMSARTLRLARAAAFLALAGLLAAFWWQVDAALVAVVTVVFLINTTILGLRVATLFAGLGAHHAEPEARADRGGPVVLADKKPLPSISILVPLFREAELVESLVAALSRLDYPRELLDVKLLLEAGDIDTRRAVATMDLPRWMEVVTVPAGDPQTKPRAMNHALDFCRGELVGIFDAEDRPEPDQLLRVARHMRAAPQEVACVQCQLSYWNAGENWLTRCFQIEYAIWFDVLLGGFRALGLPIPLGGTSVYFRRATLKRLGGWDAHNVTEDADLGMRLARRGFRCEVVRSTTLEEANCRLGSWIRQRSRWLKGYLITWLSHMRDPARLWREMGPWGFFGLNAIFLGAAASYLAMPLFWLTSLTWLLTGSTLWLDLVPDWVLWVAGSTLVLGQGVMLATATLALVRRRALRLLPWVISLPLYWTLGAAAAWKAIVELFVAPYYWDKTRHGLSRYFRRGR